MSFRSKKWYEGPNVCVERKVIQDGDEITINANADILSLNISEDEMKKRSESWKNPNLSPKSGVLAKYKKTVQSASKGAITD